MAWVVEHFQFVVFHDPSETWDAFQLWHEFFKSDPEGYQRNPDPNQRATTATGTYGGMPFQLKTQVGRIDLFVLAGVSDTPFPFIVNDAGARSLLKEVATSLAITKNCLRLAFVTQLSDDRNSVAEANKLFGELTHQNVPADATDLTFGLNVRKQNTDGGYVINRLLRWSSVVKQAILIQVGGGMPERSLPKEQPCVMLNIDVNTVVRSAPFKAEVVPGVVEELFAEGETLRENGYGELVH